MGLDLYCDKVIQRFGSYSQVQRVRVLWIKAYSMWLETIGEDNSLILATIRVDSINYDQFEVLEFGNSSFKGLYAFVYHSDCDGYWDVDEVEQILAVFELIKPYLKKLDISYFTENDEYYLENILKHSLKINTPIEFY